MLCDDKYYFRLGLFKPKLIWTEKKLGKCTLDLFAYLFLTARCLLHNVNKSATSTSNYMRFEDNESGTNATLELLPFNFWQFQ